MWFRAILMARQKPILSMLEIIRMYLLQRFTKQRLAVANWHGCIGPRISKILEKNKENSSSYIAQWSGGHDYQVKNMYGGMHAVNLRNKTCSCKRWDLSGISSFTCSCWDFTYMIMFLFMCVIQVYLAAMQLLAYGISTMTLLTMSQNVTRRRHFWPPTSTKYFQWIQ